MSSVAAPRSRQPEQPSTEGGRGPSLPLALILLGAALNLGWLGLLGWAVVRALSALLA